MLARTVFAPLVFLAATAGASAHYPMGRVTPQTLWHGLLSGFGHPVIGLDHLAFVVAMGLLAAPLARGALMPLAFLAAGAVGSALHVRGVDLPFAEAAVALSVLARRRSPGSSPRPACSTATRSPRASSERNPRRSRPISWGS